LGVSRTPLREAFRILQSEGLLTYNSHQGVIVTPVSLKDIENIWEVRYVLEGMAAEMAIEKMTNQDLQRLFAIQNRMDSLDPRDKRSIIKTNSEFHMSIIRIADNDKLEKIVKDIWLQIKVIQSISLFQQGRLLKACNEHKKILSALENRDKAQVRKLMEEHLTKGQQCLIRGMQFEN
jgi:DNA-binding GntR family transcriptional regulator